MAVAEQLKYFNQFLAKSDGRDKLLATVQYACMFISAGSAGDVMEIQKSVAAARKVFRILRPLESITPLIAEGLTLGKGPVHSEVAKKLRPAFMASYFLFDHVGWAAQAGLLTDKALIDRCQKISTWSWLLGSLSTIVIELTDILRTDIRRKEGESGEEWAARRKALDERVLRLVHAVVQALLAAGLLQLRPWSQRKTAVFGVLASALNCYMLMPPLPAPAARPKAS